MARIKISTFGGISPSVDPRNLPTEGAQTAENLELRYGDFRPLRGAGASVASVASGTLSIHRTPSGVWLQSTSDANFVDGQINDATVERVYVTGRSAYPEAWQSSAYRRLGVPAPTAAPTATASVTDEFSTQDLAAAGQEIIASVLATANAERTEIPLGGGVPGSAPSSGAIWLSHGDNAALPTTSWRQICYCVPITTSPLATVTASDAYLLDPVLGGKAIVHSAANYWAIPFTWQARGYQFDTTAMSTAYQALLKPPENTDPLFTVDEANYLASTLIGGPFDVNKDPALSYIEALDAAQLTIVNLLSGTKEDTQRAFALSTAAAYLKNASDRLESYYTATNVRLGEIVSAAVEQYVWKVPPTVERILETRGYIYTYVSDWGEESAPSPVTPLLTIDQNDSVDVSIGAPAVTSPYGTITHWRLYRSSTTNVGAAYQFVAEVPIATTSYNDTKKQEELQEVCPSLTWTEPRSDLFALTGLPNGIMVGLAEDGRILCFSEPYQPYAWPREYELSLEYPGVGIGAFGQTAVVVTTGQPCYVSGADSANMSAQKIESAQACVSKRSIVSADGGVLYASPDGICLAGPSGVELLTLGAYSREDWQALGLTTSFAAFSEGVYRLVTEN